MLRRPRVGVVGWYGHGNAGDDRILHSLRTAFVGWELVAVNAWAEAAHRLDELNACQLVLIGGGGLILRGTGRYASFVNAIRPPLCCVGISVESRHSDTRPMLSSLASKCDVIVVRDRQSAEAFPRQQDVIVAPDLTFLDPTPLVPVRPSETCALNLRPWSSWPAEFGGRRDILLRRVERSIPWLPGVLPVRSWIPDRLVRRLRRRFAELVPVPLCTSPLQDDRMELRRYFREVPAEWSPQLLEPCRYVLGMRLHSLIFACQAGIPFVSIAYQPKCTEFCCDLGLAQLAVSPYGLQGLEDALAYVVGAHDEIRRRLVAYRTASRSKVVVALDVVRACAQQ
jgi:polysaccharide pyruvyl transferase WcaK-like protein